MGFIRCQFKTQDILKEYNIIIFETGKQNITITIIQLSIYSESHYYYLAYSTMPKVTAWTEVLNDLAWKSAWKNYNDHTHIAVRDTGSLSAS